MFLCQLNKGIRKAANSASNEPSAVVCLNVGNNCKGSGGKFGIASVISGEPLKELLEVGIGVEVSGGRGEGAEGAHGGKKPE